MANYQNTQNYIRSSNYISVGQCAGLVFPCGHFSPTMPLPLLCHEAGGFWCSTYSTNSILEWGWAGWEIAPRPLSQEHSPVSYLFPFPQLSFLLPIRPHLVREEVVQLISLSSKTVVYTPPEYLKVKSQEFDSGSTVLFLPGGNLGMKHSHYCWSGGVITEKQEILEIKTALVTLPKHYPSFLDICVAQWFCQMPC